MPFHTGNKNIKPPEGRHTTKSHIVTASDDDLSLVSMCQKRTMGYHRYKKQKLEQQEIHKK
jgi:hypothetical protein